MVNSLQTVCLEYQCWGHIYLCPPQPGSSQGQTSWEYMKYEANVSVNLLVSY